MHATSLFRSSRKGASKLGLLVGLLTPMFLAVTAGVYFDLVPPRQNPEAPPLPVMEAVPATPTPAPDVLTPRERAALEEVRRVATATRAGRAVSVTLEAGATNETLALLARLPEVPSLAVKPGARITREGLAHLPALKGLRHLDLAGADLVDADLTHLQSLAGLESLSLRSCTNITDAGLVPLQSLVGLRALDLGFTSVSATGLRRLRELPGLEKLCLRGLALGNEGLAHLRGLPRLTELDLAGTRLTSSGLLHIEGLTGLTALSLSFNDGLTGEGLYYLRDMKSLGVLELDTCAVSDADLPGLAGLQSLRTLDLSRTRVTDAGLAHLTPLSGLRTLVLAETNVTPAGRAGLRRQMPMLSVK